MTSMAPADTVAGVRDWFAKAKVAALALPGGIFRHPGDNFHRLTWSATTSHKLLLEFDDQLLLILTDPGELEYTDTELTIRGCRQVTLDWQEYVNMRSHVEDHGQGDVRLTVPGEGR